MRRASLGLKLPTIGNLLAQPPIIEVRVLCRVLDCAITLNESRIGVLCTGGNKAAQKTGRRNLGLPDPLRECGAAETRDVR